MTDVGERLRQLRNRARLSQAALANRAHTTAKTISEIETGKRRRPMGHILDQLDEALGSNGELSRIAAAERSRVAAEQISPDDLAQLRAEIATLSELLRQVLAAPAAWPAWMGELAQLAGRMSDTGRDAWLIVGRQLAGDNGD